MKPLRLEDLTIEQKIGQVLTARNFSSKEDLAFVIELAKNHAIGAIQVPTTPGWMEKLGDPVKAAADYPILVGADMERGYQNGPYQISGNLAIGALDDPDACYRFAKVTAIQAKEAGFNMVWSPVVDNAGSGEPGHAVRGFSADKRKIAEFGTVYLKAFAECGVIGSAKHFPSCADSKTDSHMTESLSRGTKEELLENNLYPYLEMMKALGDDMMGIMVGHVRCVNIDPDYPASLSKKCIDLIREQGFDGMLITDSLAMMGVIQKYGDYRPLSLALAAGNDLILPNYRLSIRDVYAYMLKSWREGLFTEERLNDAVRRVLRAQERTMRMPEVSITDEDRRAVERINLDSICAKTDDGLTASIDRNAKHLFVVLTENPYPNEKDGTVGEISFCKWWDPDRVIARLKEDFPASQFMKLWEFPTHVQNERVCNAAAHADDVVYITFSSYNAYQGTDRLTERVRVLMSTMREHIAAVVHLGTPCGAEGIVHVPRMIFGMPGAVSVESALDVLAGKREAKGVMPIGLSLS